MVILWYENLIFNVLFLLVCPIIVPAEECGECSHVNIIFLFYIHSYLLVLFVLRIALHFKDCAKFININNAILFLFVGGSAKKIMLGLACLSAYTVFEGANSMA